MAPRLALVAPWAGLIAAPIAWYAHQQGLGDLIYFRCGTADALTNIAGGAIALAALAAAGLCSATTLKSPGPELQRFAALISLLAVGVFGLAILFQTMAGAMIPACAR